MIVDQHPALLVVFKLFNFLDDGLIELFVFLLVERFSKVTFHGGLWRAHTDFLKFKMACVLLEGDELS